MRKILLLTIMVLMALVVSPAVVHAIADPDTPPQVSAVYVYEDLLEDGDAGVLVDYYIDYGTLPDETATDAYMVAFVDTDGATQLKTVAPYTYQGSGYGRGLVWIYFTAAEVTANSIVSANETLYEVWLVGNPTLSWPGDPPKTIATIDYWQPSGSSAATLLALRVLYYADVLELIWALDLIEQTALGNRLTSAGESYFENVIANLRTMAPSAFASGEFDPVVEDLDYEPTFSAAMTNDTGVVTGSPVILEEGITTVNVTSAGSFILELAKGTSGNISNGTGLVTNSPVLLVWGTNNVTANTTGTLLVDVSMASTQTRLTDTVAGTGFDLTGVAAEFGMSRMMFSGLVWTLISVLVCAAVYRGYNTRSGFAGRGAGKVVLLVFDICIIGGAVMGMLTILMAVLMFIAFGALTAFVVFYKGASY